MTDIALPETLRIGPHNFSVNDKGWRLNDDCLGYCDKKTMQIVVDTDLPPLRMVETYIHEIMHAIWLSMGLEFETDEETAVRGLSLGLLSFFRDNRDGFDPVYDAIDASESREEAKKPHPMGTFG